MLVSSFTVALAAERHCDYMVHDVDAAIAWYTKHLGFTVLSNAAPAFADVTLGSLRLLLSGPDQLSRVAHARWRSPRGWWLEPRHEARFGEGACRFRVGRAKLVSS
jgi:catechol 2,3-dioxygenase-like lactoylglutathione lyase family enzyme